MLRKSFDTRFKSDGGDLEEGEFIAYPSTFTREPDCYGDVVAKGAFLDSIREWKESGNTLPVLYGHRMDDPDYNIAGVTDMGEDDHGWWIRARFDMDSPKAAQTYRLLKAKRLTQLSFAFDVLDEATVELDDGRKANELRRLKVYEASLVPVGANQDTSVVEVKSVKEGRQLSQRNVDTLRTIADTLDGAASDINTLLADAAPARPAEPKTTDGDERKTDDPDGRKAVQERRIETLDLAISIALIGGKDNDQ